MSDKKCSDCPLNAKCGLCEIYQNWIKEHKKQVKNNSKTTEKEG
jgi:hypothetical protein